MKLLVFVLFFRAAAIERHATLPLISFLVKG